MAATGAAAIAIWNHVDLGDASIAIGILLIIPLLDRVAAIIDGRIQTSAFNVEHAFTQDRVRVNVDAIVFWRIEDAGKAALAVTNYREAMDGVPSPRCGK